MVDRIFGKLLSTYEHMTHASTDHQQGAALLSGSAFMFFSRLLHDKALNTKW